jgi:large subunit ribosomal protein L31
MQNCQRGCATFDFTSKKRYNSPDMKKDLHPTNYRPVVFQDLNNNETYLTKSTVATDDTIKVDGVEYPLVKVHISSSSHPFFTGEERVLDIEGRVDKFKARAAAGAAAKDKRAAAAKKQSTRAAAKAAKAADVVNRTDAPTPKNS